MGTPGYEVGVSDVEITVVCTPLGEISEWSGYKEDLEVM